MRNDPEGIGPVWSMIGGLMFLIALLAPLAIVHMGAPPVVNDGLLAQGLISKASTTEVRRVDATARSATHRERSLQTMVSNGPLVAGSRAGQLRIGADANRIIGDISEPAALVYEMHGAQMLRRHDVTTEDLHIAIYSHADTARISALHIATRDCVLLQRLSGGADSSPSMASGISIGSRFSRVTARLGLPGNLTEQADGTTWAQVARHVYPGLIVEYCPETPIVAALSIAPVNDDDAEIVVSRVVPLLAAPDVATATSSGQWPVRDTLGGTPRAYLSQTFEDPTERLGGSTDKPSGLPRADAAPILHATGPDALLSLNGNAFERVDLFESDTALPATDGEIAAERTAADALIPAPSVDPLPIVAAESVEQNLGLGTRKRREIQIRLSLMGHSPKGADGIFGPRTRNAILAFQESVGLAATGFLDAETYELLEHRSNRDFARWRKNARERKAAPQTPRRIEPAVVAARVPPARNAPECARDRNGIIVPHQSWACDVTTFEESIGLPGLFDGEG